MGRNIASPYLDAAVSSRLAAADARLNNLDAAISSRLSTAVNSVQSGYVDATTTNGSGEDAGYIDVTISAVNTAKSIVIIHPGYINTSMMARGRLISSTTLRLSINNGGVNAIYVRWQVLEFK